MILTVTLNAAVDRTYRCDGFRLDVVNRPQECWIVAGGKGINVARVITRMGGQAVATGFLGGHNGDIIADSLRTEGIRGEFVRTAGESRTCIAAVDHLRQTQTEINEVGPEISRAECEALKARLVELIDELRPYCVVFSGSAPPGVPESIYADLGGKVSSAGVRWVLDTSGPALRLGASAVPWMIKPNAVELEHLTGEKPEGVREVARLASGLVRQGIEVVAATMGADGCVVATADGPWWIRPPEVPFVSAVGSGDSLVGAFVLATEQGQSVLDAARQGVGAGTANACRYGAGFIDAATVRQIAERCEVTRLHGGFRG
ncbi:MAG: 1-phosphofructokinase [Chthonomonadales bacterium]|nr:1-phosphofructokinase [Chthonomonadales bacterium]